MSLKGSEAASGRMGPAAHFLRGHVQHHRRVGHSHLERGAPQDRVRLQPDGPRLPRPWTLGQRAGGAEGSGHHRGGVSTQRLSKHTHTPRNEDTTGWSLQTHDPVRGSTAGQTSYFQKTHLKQKRTSKNLI